MTPLARDTGIPDPQRSRRHGYLAAIGITAIVLAVRLAASRWFGTNVPYLPFYPAILLAAWLGGLGPGLLRDRPVSRRRDVLAGWAGGAGGEFSAGP